MPCMPDARPRVRQVGIGDGADFGILQRHRIARVLAVRHSVQPHQLAAQVEAADLSRPSASSRLVLKEPLRTA